MEDRNKKISIVFFVLVLALLMIGIVMTGGNSGTELSIKDTMRDQVLHDINKINLFGIKSVNPGLVSAIVVTGLIFVLALCIRIFAIPKFKMVPGKLQLILEQAVNLFDGMAKSGSEKINGFLGAYIFAAGVYVFFGTIFELIGFQAITETGEAVSLPAPLSDINGAIMMGCLSYLVIMSGGILGNGVRGIGKTLKEYSLPISMSFRLFGALLSGALVTELVYYYKHLSFVLPVLVGVMFTLLHAVIQAYVLTMLTSMFYGEVSEYKPKVKKLKEKMKEQATMEP